LAEVNADAITSGQYVLPYLLRISRSIRRFSARSLAISHEPAAKIPSSTSTKNARQLLSICKSPFLRRRNMGDSCDFDPYFGQFSAKTAARFGYAAFDSRSDCDVKFTARAFTFPELIASAAGRF
jgi:hypothetical protein